jgi:glycosyltransferase involved in cell wall biosynthesis
MQKTILISIPWFTPAFKAGGPIQSVANLVNSYNNKITYKIVSSNADVDQQLLKNVKYNEWVDFSSNSSVYYQSKYGIQQTINFWKSIKNADTLFIIGIYSLKFNLFPLIFSSSKNKILSVRGMLHPGALSQKSFKKKLFLFFLKSIKIQNKIFFHATDETEKTYIQRIFGNRSKIYVADNYPKLNIHSKSELKEKGSLKLISIALISPMKNHLLVLQSLKQCEGEIEYHIIGAIKDQHYWNLCLKEIKEMPGNIKIIFHGEVPPDEIIQYLSIAHVFILPSKSENYGHAIIEALSAGKPIITSNNTPWNNLKQSKCGFNVNLNCEEISDSIHYFIEQNNEEYEIYSKNAYEYSKSQINFERLNTQYEIMFSKKYN